VKIVLVDVPLRLLPDPRPAGTSNPVRSRTASRSLDEEPSDHLGYERELEGLTEELEACRLVEPRREVTRLAAEHLLRR
jgi:hypothetical protein